MISYFSGAVVARVTQTGRATLLKTPQSSFRVQGLCGEAEVWARRKKRKTPRTRSSCKVNVGFLIQAGVSGEHGKEEKPPAVLSFQDKDKASCFSACWRQLVTGV